MALLRSSHRIHSPDLLPLANRNADRGGLRSSFKFFRISVPVRKLDHGALEEALQFSRVRSVWVVPSRQGHMTCQPEGS